MADLKEMMESATLRKNRYAEQARDLAGQIQGAQMELEKLNSMIIFENGKIAALQDLVDEQATQENGRLEYDEIKGTIEAVK